MSDRGARKRFWKITFLLTVTLYLILVVANRVAPSAFPDWSKPVLTVFEGLED